LRLPQKKEKKLEQGTKYFLCMPSEPNNRDISLYTTYYMRRMGPTYASVKSFLRNMLAILLVFFESRESALLSRRYKVSPNMWNQKEFL